MLDQECIAALKRVALAEKTTPVNALVPGLVDGLQLGHLMFEGYIEADVGADLRLTDFGRRALEEVL